MAWSSKAYALYNLKRYDEALQAIGKATELDPQNAYLWNNKGLVLEALGRSEEANECRNKAKELGPKSEQGNRLLSVFGH